MIIPCLNESENIETLANEISEECRCNKISTELIFKCN